MWTRVIVLLAAGAGTGFCGEWNPQLAADYPDSRQQAWLAWRTAIHSGGWAAESMNKRYERDSMQSQFMRDAATGFASLALLAGQ